MPWGMQDDFTAPGQWTLLEDKKRPRKIVVHGPKKLARTIMAQLNAIPQVENGIEAIRRCNGQGADGSYGCTHCFAIAETLLDNLDG